MTTWLASNWWRTNLNQSREITPLDKASKQLVFPKDIPNLQKVWGELNVGDRILVRRFVNSEYRKVYVIYAGIVGAMTEDEHGKNYIVRFSKTKEFSPAFNLNQDSSPTSAILKPLKLRAEAEELSL